MVDEVDQSVQKWFALAQLNIMRGNKRACLEEGFIYIAALSLSFLPATKHPHRRQPLGH